MTVATFSGSKPAGDLRQAARQILTFCRGATTQGTLVNGTPHYVLGHATGALPVGNVKVVGISGSTIVTTALAATNVVLTVYKNDTSTPIMTCNLSLASGAPTNVQSTSQTVVTAASDTLLSTDGLIVELKVDGAGNFVMTWLNVQVHLESADG